MSLDKKKFEYIKSILLSRFHKGYNTISIPCEFCGVKLEGSLWVTSTGKGGYVKTSGEFHHDANENLHLYCYTCHKMIHEWGVIQRWLDNIGKRVEDLPDARKLRKLLWFLPYK